MIVVFGSLGVSAEVSVWWDGGIGEGNDERIYIEEELDLGSLY
jgi:hypothetical protein